MEALEHSISSKSLGNRFSTFENRISLLESTLRSNAEEQDNAVRTVKGMASDVERIQTSVEKQVQKVLKQMDALQEETEKVKMESISKNNDATRTSSSFSRRLTQRAIVK